MRRLVRQFRRPVVMLILLYISSVWFLASSLHYSPTATLRRGDYDGMLVGFSSDGQRLAVGPGVARISTAGPDDRLPLPENPFSVWDISPNHVPSQLAVPSGEELARLPFGVSRLFEPELSEGEPPITFSPDGRRLAVMSDDAIRIWDLPIRKPWSLILPVALIPPVALGLLFLAVRFVRRVRPSRPARPRAV